MVQFEKWIKYRRPLAEPKIKHLSSWDREIFEYYKTNIIYVNSAFAAWPTWLTQPLCFVIYFWASFALTVFLSLVYL